MQIRYAEPRDIPGILALLDQVGEVHHRIRPDIFRSGARKYDEAALSALLEDRSRPIFVAVEESQLRGYCFCVLRDHQGSGTMTDRREVYIDDLCVEERCRGTGVASALFRWVRAWARDLGCAFVTLNVWCGNEGAEKFYAHMGMTPRSITMELPLEELC